MGANPPRPAATPTPGWSSERRIKARVRTLQDVHLEGFPEGDDLWWIRWFDYGGSGGGTVGTPTIRVTMSQLKPRYTLDDLPFLDERLASARVPWAVATLQAG